MLGSFLHFVLGKYYKDEGTWVNKVFFYLKNVGNNLTIRSNWVKHGIFTSSEPEQSLASEVDIPGK